jgi:hypothetical protein
MLRLAYGDNALKKYGVSEWHKRFTEGQESVKHDERLRQPESQRSCKNVERVPQIVWSGR